MTTDPARILPDGPRPRMTPATLAGLCAVTAAIYDDSTVSPARAGATRDELWRVVAWMHCPETGRYAPALDHGTSFLLLAKRHGLLTERQVAAAMAVEESDAL